MLRFTSKQAQNLTTKDDAALRDVVRPFGNFAKEELRKRKQDKRRGYGRQNVRQNVGSCRYCKGPLDHRTDVTTGRSTRYCPNCNPPKNNQV